MVVHVLQTSRRCTIGLKLPHPSTPSRLTLLGNPENHQAPANSLESVTAAATQCLADTPTILPTASLEFRLHTTPTASRHPSIGYSLPHPPHQVVQLSSDTTRIFNLLPADPQAASASPGLQIDQLTTDSRSRWRLTSSALHWRCRLSSFGWFQVGDCHFYIT